MEHKPIKFDPADFSRMCELMDEYGDSDFLIDAINENSEEVEISIFKERINTVTFQHNGWIRKNVYWRDGTREELFEGKWK